MKKLSIVLLIMLSLNTSNAADWVEEESYDWAWNGHKVSNVVIALHGLAKDEPRLDRFPREYLEPLIDSGSLAITPYSSSMYIDDTKYYAWDVTGQRTNDREAQDIINLITLVDDLFRKPIYIVGGSGGSLMAYRVYTELLRIGKETLISKLVLLDGTSPYAIQIEDYEALAYIGTPVRYLYNLIGHTYVKPLNRFHNFQYLGLSNRYIKINTPILVINSLEDTVVPDYIKTDFEIAIRKAGNNVTIKHIGTNHAVGQEGWDYVYKWLGR